jgi:hypothetical protein
MPFFQKKASKAALIIISVDCIVRSLVPGPKSGASTEKEKINAKAPRCRGAKKE